MKPKSLVKEVTQMKIINTFPIKTLAVLLIFASFVSYPLVSYSQEASHSSTQEEKTAVIPIEGMSCSACAARIKKTLNAIDGISDVEINLADRNARIRFVPSKINPDRLVSEINALGYHASLPKEAAQ